jgi:hypothetical protein
MEGAKIEEDSLRVLKIFHCSFDFNKYKQKNSTSEKRDGNGHVLSNSRQAILPCLLFADAGNLSISQRLSNTLLELRRGYPIAFWHFPAAFPYPFSSAQRLSHGL